MAVCEAFMPPTTFVLNREGGLRCFEMSVPPPSNTFADKCSAKHREVAVQKRKHETEDVRDRQFDLWTSIQASKKEASAAVVDLQPPYVHPMLRRSASSLSQQSLEICTESLGSETGSDGFSDVEDYYCNSSSETQDDEFEQEGKEDGVGFGRKELEAVNYHCSIGRKFPTMSFPPPLPSISRRDGPCLHIRPHRRDGRLVVEAVPVPSQNYLHCQRQDGRLLLSFIETSFEEIYPEIEDPVVVKRRQEVEEEEVEEGDVVEEGEEDIEEDMEEEEVVEEEEEEVEVVDRGIVVEVKVSRQPQSGRLMKVHRSSLVINKFVGGTPVTNWKEEKIDEDLLEREELVPRCTPTTSVTAAPAVQNIGIVEVELWGSGRGEQQAVVAEVLSTKKVMNRQNLLKQVRSCRLEHHKPLFIWETCCIALN